MASAIFNRKFKSHHLYPEIKYFLKLQGFTIRRIWQPWRHVVALINKNNKAYFFKMATSQELGIGTRNEVDWHTYTKNNLPLQSPFSLPTIYDQGIFGNNLFYFIADYLGDQTLADKYPLRTKKLSWWIDKIAMAAFIICEIKFSPSKEDVLVGQKLFDHANKWAKEIDQDLESLFSVIANYKSSIQGSYAHGDFVPWHMYDLGNGKFGLVDVEHGGWKPKYYDIAYFYERVHHNLEAKELARKFLVEFKKQLKHDEQKTFWEELKPILAQRLIGRYWEIETSHENHKEIEMDKCEELKTDLLNDRII